MHGISKKKKAKGHLPVKALARKGSDWPEVERWGNCIPKKAE